jgi:phosphatidate phosphatase LPIN
VRFTVNDVEQNYAMKLGEGGEAFFVFETTAAIPEEMQTSPLASPEASPEQKPIETPSSQNLSEPEPLSLDGGSGMRRGRLSVSVPPNDYDNHALNRPMSGDWSGLPRSTTDDVLPSARAGFAKEFDGANEDGKDHIPIQISREEATAWNRTVSRSTSPPPLSPSEAMARAINLSKKLFVSNIPNEVTDSGDLKLDMTGYKSSEEEALRAEVVARKILGDELEGNYDIGALIGTDEQGNLWIYSSEEAKAAAARKATLSMLGEDALRSADAVSDPGYHSDDAQSDTTAEYAPHMRRDSDSAVGLTTPPQSPSAPTRSYAKTLRLTSEQLKALDLSPGANSMSFTVNRSTCQAYMYLWKHDVPIVISDIDGTITKSDALGHVLNMIGRDWTHLGVAKLYTDIVSNGYNIFYLTSRSVGQADMTRTYLNGVIQEGYRLPKGPVIMSPDRTIAALRREVYLRKPEVFKMACLRDIMNLFNKPAGQTPFYAGFGNRLTDALSYRSVNIPSTRIFTINSNAEVSLDVLSLNSYKTGYASMREIVDHFFPPVGLLVPAGGEDYTDFNYWRERPMDLEDFTDSEDEEDDETEAGSIRSEDEGSEIGEDLEASYMSQDPFDDRGGLEDSIVESVEGDYSEEGDDEEDEQEDEEDEEEEDDDDDDDEDEEDEDEDEEDGTPTKEVTTEFEGTVVQMETLEIRESTPTQLNQGRTRAKSTPVASRR